MALELVMGKRGQRSGMCKTDGLGLQAQVRQVERAAFAVPKQTGSTKREPAAGGARTVAGFGLR